MNKIIVELVLNEKGHIVPMSFPEGFNYNAKMEQVQYFRVNGYIKKIAYSEQSPSKSLEAYKTGQKGGDPSITTTGMHESIKQELEAYNKVTVDIVLVEQCKTPKQQADQELEEYYKAHGKYPDWNKQKNHTKW